MHVYTEEGYIHLYMRLQYTAYVLQLSLMRPIRGLDFINTVVK